MNLENGSCVSTITSIRSVFDYSTCTSEQLVCRVPGGPSGTQPWSDNARPYGQGDLAKGWFNFTQQKDFERVHAKVSGTGCAEYHYTHEGNFRCSAGMREVLISHTFLNQERQADCTTGETGISYWKVTKNCIAASR